MTPKVLFIITGDPQISPRPAEAIRIAAGVGAWQQVKVTVYLRGSAVLVLCPSAEEFPDADHYARYLPMLAERESSVFVQEGAPEAESLGEAVLPYQTLSEAGLAEMAANSDYVLRF
jgi:hypothetical protein